MQPLSFGFNLLNYIDMELLADDGELAEFSIDAA
jgi:hypothetical protein